MLNDRSTTLKRLLLAAAKYLYKSQTQKREYGLNEKQH